MDEQPAGSRQPQREIRWHPGTRTPAVAPAVGVALALCLAVIAAACVPAPTPGLDLGAPSPAATEIADADALARHLTEAGVSLAPQGDKIYEWFAPPGRTYAIGDGNLVVHTYESDAAAAEAADGVSPDGRRVTGPEGNGVRVQWPQAARFYRHGPLLAVYVGTDIQVMHLMALALGDQFAGPAAPPGVGVR